MTLTNARNTTDTYISGKLYKKLDAYLINSKGELEYFTSSNQFKTQRNFKNWLANNVDSVNTRYVTIKRGE